MDLGIRQALQKALLHIDGPHAAIAVRCKNGRRLVLRCDLVCYENHIEGTDDEGRPLTVPYSEVATVEATEADTGSVVKP
jgi:hypothetical protein